MTTAAKVIEQVRTIAAGERGMSLRDSSCMASLRVGERAHWAISDAAGWWGAVHHGRPLPALYGVPLVPVPDLGAGWQLLNVAGAVIAEGDIES